MTKIMQNTNCKIIHIKKIKDNIRRQIVPYNYLAKKDSINRFDETKLTKVDIEGLPKYIKKNINKFKEWIVSLK